MGAARKPRQSKKSTLNGTGTTSGGGGIGGGRNDNSSSNISLFTGTGILTASNILNHHEACLNDFSSIQKLAQELKEINLGKRDHFSQETKDYHRAKTDIIKDIAAVAEEIRIKKEKATKDHSKLKETDKKALNEAFETLFTCEKELMSISNPTILEIIRNIDINVIPQTTSVPLPTQEFQAVETDHTNYIINTYAIIDELVELESGPPPTDDKEVERVHKRKKELTNQYLIKINLATSIDPARVDANFTRCSECDSTLIDHEDGNLVCVECGKTLIGHICINSNFSYKELQNYVSKPQFTYKKETHFLEHVRRFISQENKTIDPAILEKIVAEARKHHITNLNNLKEDTVKKFLKTLGLKDYYDNVINIINLLTGRKPFVLTKEIEEKLKLMFNQIQQPFYKHKPDSRKNFFSYPYIMFQFFTILDLQEFTKYFSLLKSVDKLRAQDQIFQKIVADLAPVDKTIRWRFTPCA